MTSGNDNPIRDFSAANWVRYTRETITQQLIEAGYEKTDGLIGTAEFEDLAPEVEFPGDEVPEPISGTVNWACE